MDELTKRGLDAIPKGDERMESYCEDTMMRGEPDLVIRARDEKEVSEVLAHCNGNGIPVTFCASQTSMTGASVAMGGVLVSTEKLEGIVDISEKGGRATVTARPGTITSDVQKAVAEAGWFFPVGPTSRDECRIGANVATNATGEDSYKYGTLRPYVRRARLLMADGSERIVERITDDACTCERMRGGYETSWKNPIDLIIGSEGTLAFVADVTLDLLPAAPSFYTLLAPFKDNRSAISFIVDVASGGDRTVRALELIDGGALAAMKTAEGCHQFPEDVAALVYLKQEYADDSAMQNSLERWYEKITAVSGGSLAESILVAETDKQKEDFRLWRHRIPEWANEQGRERWAGGGGKVGSDWWVPVKKLPQILDYFYKLAEEAGFPHMAYAHAGSGHPHTNLLTKNNMDHHRANEILIRCCTKAVALGGGVSGEHGLGKFHTDLLPIAHPEETIQKMIQWKREYDPKMILGRGNIFAV